MVHISLLGLYAHKDLKLVCFKYNGVAVHYFMDTLLQLENCRRLRLFTDKSFLF
jgi:hypothetical protein